MEEIIFCTVGIIRYIGKVLTQVFPAYRDYSASIRGV